MKDPERWLSSGDAPEEVLRLLSGGSPPRALPSAVERRSRRRLSAFSAVPAAAGAFFWVPHLALGAALGTVVASAVVAPRLVSEWKHREPVQAPAVPQRAAEPRRDPSALRETPSLPLPSPTPEPPRESPRPREASSAALGLEREARLLERARSLLASDPGAALGFLERHAVDAPHGALTVERELLEVDALVRLGRRREAEAKAKALRSHAPGSIYERRLSELLGER